MTQVVPDDKRQAGEIKVKARPYHAPHLQVYGAIRELTASGSRGVLEEGMSTNNPDKRP